MHALCDRLNLAPMTIRQHLAKLLAQGLIRAETERRPTGRPAYAYYLTAAAEDRFPKAYDRLAGALIQAAALIDPQHLIGVTADQRRHTLFEAAARRAAQPHLPTLRPLHPDARVRAAVAILHDESAFTELAQGPDGPEIHEYNCVFRRIAQEDCSVCSFHTAYVGELLGQEVALVSRQCDGDPVCRFRPLAQAHDGPPITATTP